METPQSIHAFWFGDDAGEPDDAVAIARQSKLWWSKDANLDAQVRARFEPTVIAAGAGALEHWAAQPIGLLALVLATDQFPRNIYRDSPRAFAFDAKARELCRQALARGDDLALRPVERVFLYLPLEHSEDMRDQDDALRLFAALAGTVSERTRAAFEGFLDYARRHRDIIERFGRFPHRNAILGRESTAAERDFLSRPGSSF